MIRDFSLSDTTPGATGPHASLAPPLGFQGDEQAYVDWLHVQARHDLGIAQIIDLMAHHTVGKARIAPGNLRYCGPFAEALSGLITYLGQRIKAGSTASNAVWRDGPPSTSLFEHAA